MQASLRRKSTSQICAPLCHKIEKNGQTSVQKKCGKITFLDTGKQTVSISVCADMTLAFDRMARFGSITTIKTSGEKIVCAYGDDQNLFEVLVDNAIMTASGTCMGNQACGKCQVKIISGTITPMEDEEKEILGDAQPNHRLACAITLTADSDGAVLEVI